MKNILFIITPPTGERKWAERKWDTYGFDYDKERSGDQTVFAWALEDVEALKAALDADGIEYRTTDFDPDEWFNQRLP